MSDIANMLRNTHEILIDRINATIDQREIYVREGYNDQRWNTEAKSELIRSIEFNLKLACIYYSDCYHEDDHMTNDTLITNLTSLCDSYRRIQKL